MCSSPTRNSLCSCYLPKKFGIHIQEKLILMYKEKSFDSFYTFEKKHFLAVEDFLNMYLDKPLNITPGI